MVTKEKITMITLDQIRFRSLSNCLILVDNAHEMSGNEVKALLSKVGEGCKLILVGDVQGIEDVTLTERNNGLSSLIGRLIDTGSFAFIHLEGAERSPISKTADLL